MIKTKIILDADVIIHFSKGNRLSDLPEIFKGYEYIVLETVYNEIHEPLKSQLDNQINYLKNIKILPFSPKGEILKEYAMLTKTLGRGESACMAYCRFHHDVIGSSNLKDIKDYCSKYEITYLTTLDFLYYAIQHKIISINEANLFVQEVCNKDSKLPNVDFNTFISHAII